MSSGRRQSVGPFPDRCVIYWAPKDKCWVAHSLRMDQIGTGHGVVDALAALLRAVSFVIEDAAQDPTLAVFREAPPEVQVLADSAKRLPKEVFDIAHKVAIGKWPQELPPVRFRAKSNLPWKAAISEKAVAAAV